MASNLMPGATGMVELIYVGGNVGNTPFRGKVTGTTYVFSRLKPRRWVDSRDAEVFVGLIENKHHLFEYVRPTAPLPEPQPAPEAPALQPEPALAEAANLKANLNFSVVGPAVSMESPVMDWRMNLDDFDPRAHPARVVLEAIPLLTPEQLRAALDREEFSDRPRKSVAAAIKKAIGEHDNVTS